MQEHPAFADLLNHYLSFATIIGAVCVIVFFGALIYLSYKKDLEKYAKYLGDYIFPIGFFITLGGSFLTLFYQYILNYEPCDLCWYQRVFLYPQVLMFAYAWYKKDRAVLPYALVLSVAGFAVALYHVQTRRRSTDHVWPIQVSSLSAMQTPAPVAEKQQPIIVQFSNCRKVTLVSVLAYHSLMVL